MNKSCHSLLPEKAETLHIILRYFVYLLAFLFYAWLSCHIPFSADDWRWGTEIGMEEFLNASINSRYAGNLFVIIMMRSRFLCMVIMATVSCMIPVLITKLAIKRKSGNNHILFFVIANILYFCAGSRIWSETNGWIAGYANFVVSSLFMLINLTVWTQILEPDYLHKKDSVLSCILMFLVTLTGQLFIENLSIVNVIMAVAFLYAYYRKTKHISLKYVSMTVGAILGLIIMFSSSIYSKLFRTGEVLDGYRQILFLSKGSIGELIFSFAYQCARLVVRIGEENAILTMSILIVLALRLNVKSHSKGTIILTVSNIVFCAYYLIVGVCGVMYDDNNLLLAMVAALINLLYMLLVLFELYILYRSKESDAGKAIFYWLFSLFTIVPLVFTSENGARLLYMFETGAIVMVIVLLYPLVSKLSPKKMLMLAMDLLVQLHRLSKSLVSTNQPLF